MAKLRFLKQPFKRSKKTAHLSNPRPQTTDTGAGCDRDSKGEHRSGKIPADEADQIGSTTAPEDDHEGGSRKGIANQDGRIGDQQLPTPNTSTQTPGHGGDDASECGRV